MYVIVIGIAVGLYILTKGVYKTGNTIVNRINSYNDLISQAARETGLSTDVIKGVIYIESAGDPNAKGSYGEVGLMQVRDVAAQELGYTKASSDPETNILQGSGYLAKMLRLSGNIYDALRSYNCGFTGAMNNPDCGKLYAEHVLKATQYFS